MTCFGYKGGIGSASRSLALGKDPFTSGSSCSQLRAARRSPLPDGRTPPLLERRKARIRGSIIIVMGTDAPLDHRQLTRVLKRSAVGLARLGSFWSHGSGDIAIGFSTSRHLHHDEERIIVPTAPG